MLKFYNDMVVFEEVPDEITLAINITNCPCHCEGCHSKFLWEDTGLYLTTTGIDGLIKANDGITCVCFMGGDREPEEVNKLASYVKTHYGLKTAWYSGYDTLSNKIDLKNFDYVKIGRYDKDLGGLDKETTNQIFYKVHDDQTLENITHRFKHKLH